jgi:hypothetical protein
VTERRFSEQEFALILRRATEMKDHPDAPVPARDGLTLGEMKAIARDVGIDPALVERAATSLGAAGSSKTRAILGGPTRLVLEHATSGTLDPERYAHVVDAVRRVTGQHGETREELGGLVWKNRGDLNQVHVVVRPDGDQTRIQLTADRDASALLTWFSGVAGGLIGGGLLGAILEPTTFLGGAAILGGMGTAGVAVARTLWARSSKRFSAKFSALFGTVREEVEGAIAAGEEPGPTGQPRLGADVP